MIQREFPAAVPEIPVERMDPAVDHYRDCLGFTVDWRDTGGGISGVSRGACRLFLTDAAFRSTHANAKPVVIWLNLESIDEVDALHAEWVDTGATIVSPPGKAQARAMGMQNWPCAPRPDAKPLNPTSLPSGGTLRHPGNRDAPRENGWEAGIRTRSKPVV